MKSPLSHNQKVMLNADYLRRFGGMILILPCVTSGGEALLGLTLTAEESAPRGTIFNIKRGIFSAGSSFSKSELRYHRNIC